MLRRLAVIVTALLVVFTALITWNYLRPIPAVAAAQSVPVQSLIPGAPPVLPWPKTGSGAVAVSGLGIVASSGNEQPTATASVAKVMTALIVLADRPLKKDEAGPSISVAPGDVADYGAKKAAGESVVQVAAGEQLTELQALEGLLIPSGNNIADLLARWDAGDIPTFIARMNARAKAMGLTRTTFVDAYGADPKTVSTASDLVRLGMAAMQDPVFAAIVSMQQATLPVAGTVYNVDYVLGQSGIIGIKTGSGGDLGANFLFAATGSAAGHPVTLYGCVMGLGTLDDAFNASKALLAAVPAGLKVERVVAKNQAIGRYTTPWGASSDLLATQDVDLVEWPGMVIRQRLDAPALTLKKPLAAGFSAGSLRILLGDYAVEVPAVTASPLYQPSNAWRLTRLKNG